MKKCAKKCMEENSACQKTDCRLWIDYRDENNCALISIEKNGDMTLQEVAERMKISYVRVKQIQDSSLVKLAKRIRVIAQ